MSTLEKNDSFLEIENFKIYVFHAVRTKS